jgi:large subunit ribosomal protein L30
VTAGVEVGVAAERGSGAAGRPLKVTWVRSTIGHKAGARGTIRALGLHRLNQTVEVADTPVTRGMLRRIAFLVDVVEPGEARAQPREGDPK